MTNIIMVAAVAILVAMLLIAFIISRIIYICPPNEVLIFSGGHRKLPGTADTVVGYRIVQGGRGIRIPLIEVDDRMDLTNMIIELRVQGAYSRGGIPLNVQGVTNVKVSSKVDQLANAIERFLGMTREQIMAVARETLEGNLRGVLSTLTPEAVNQDREKFAGELLHEETMIHARRHRPVQAIVGNLAANLRNTRAVFDDIRSSPAQTGDTGPGFIQLSWSRIAVQNQGMIFDAGRLAHLLRDQADEMRQARTLLILALAGAFVAFLFTSYTLFFRRALDSIADLQEGARIVGSGELGYEIPEKGDDEITDLSRSFNRMTANLKTVIASKTELERGPGA